MKKVLSDRLHLLFLLGWIVVGAGLRFAWLDGKPPWTDEFSTMVFSLGNSFRTVPLDQVISLDALLQPLRPDPAATPVDVVHHLMTESTHPPVYFVLSHLWLRLFPTESGLVSLWGARSLSALLGVFSIPALFGLGWLAFGSRRVGQLAAALMAVSPYGIFLAQEARHYTLAILLVIASLSCLVAAARHLIGRHPIPLWLCLLWVVANSLGVAVHYLFALTLMAETLVLLVWWLWPLRSLPDKLRALPAGVSGLGTNLWRLGAIAAGTFVGGLVWLPEVRQSHGSTLTEWIAFDWDYPLSFINPLFQLLAAWITMLSLLPVEADALPIILLSGAVMIAFFVWLIPRLVRALRLQLQTPSGQQATRVLGGFVLAAIALFLVGSYLLGKDLTRGARYNFVYFPAVLVLVAAGLAASGTGSQKPATSSPVPTGKRAIALVLLMGFLSGLTVVTNLGYQKYYRPDLFAGQIQQATQAPALVVTTHQTHVHTGEMMGVARELKLQGRDRDLPHFLLAHYTQEPEETLPLLRDAIAALPRPLDLWMVNLNMKLPTPPPGCEADPNYADRIDGYKYRLYRCRPT